MTFEGTTINGVIILDGAAKLPEGTRVLVAVADPVPPVEPFDRDKELAIVRESLDDIRAGRGMPFEQFMADLAAEYKLPPNTPE